MTLFTEQLYRSFQTHTGNAALKIGDKTYTYGEILQISSGIRMHLKNCSSQNIGLFLTGDVEMYAAILAIWFEGKTYVPVHPDFPLKRNQQIISQAEIKTLISSVPMTKSFDIEIISSEGLTGDIVNPPLEADPLYNAYILFTSGSTGEPKGVPITFSSLSYFIDSYHDTFGGITEKDTFLQMFELTFDMSVFSYLLPWLHGAEVVGLHKKEAKFLQILDLLEADEITVAHMVPSILNLIQPYLDSEIQNSSLRLNLFAGEPLLTRQMSFWRSFVPNAEIYNTYGPTENTIICTAYKIDGTIDDRNGIISIGKPMKHNDILLVDENFSQGELLLGGKLLTAGYWKNPQKTAEAFINKNGKRFYKTGDWCEKDGNGNIFYKNRIDFQGKINGFRVELSEIEYLANQITDAASTAVIYKDGHSNDQLALFVQGSHEVTDLRNKLSELLPDYAVPSKIICLERFPLNTSGKIDRHELIKLLQ